MQKAYPSFLSSLWSTITSMSPSLSAQFYTENCLSIFTFPVPLSCSFSFLSIDYNLTNWKIQLLCLLFIACLSLHWHRRSTKAGNLVSFVLLLCSQASANLHDTQKSLHKHLWNIHWMNFLLYFTSHLLTGSKWKSRSSYAGRFLFAPPDPFVCLQLALCWDGRLCRLTPLPSGFWPGAIRMSRFILPWLPPKLQHTGQPSP